MASDLIKYGMLQFRKFEVIESIETFDEVIVRDEGQRPFLWQRGLSLYYANRFEEAAEQFRFDVSVNPNDTEESIWACLCEAQYSTFEMARSNLLIVGRDSRPVMRVAYDLFKGVSTIQSLETAASASPHAEFYSLLYQGLYYEAIRNSESAKSKILQSINTEYALTQDDYMVSLARVHVHLRQWEGRDPVMSVGPDQVNEN